MKLQGTEAVMTIVPQGTNDLFVVTPSNKAAIAFSVPSNLRHILCTTAGHHNLADGITISHPIPNTSRISLIDGTIITSTPDELTRVIDAIPAFVPPPPLHRSNMNESTTEDTSAQNQVLAVFPNTAASRTIILHAFPGIRDLTDVAHTPQRGRQWVCVFRSTRHNYLGAYYTGNVRLF